MNNLRVMFLVVVIGMLSLPTQLIYANPGEDTPKQPPVEAVEDDEDELVSADAFEPGLWVEKAVTMLEEQITKSPDKRIPQTLLDNAKCVVMFPEVVQAGLGLGGKFGRGMVSCRNAQTGDWGTPVFLRLTSINWGVQIGAQSADVIMLVMNDKGLDKLFGGKPLVGAGAGVAAGPVGRDTTANIDVLLQTPIITYTRSKGLYIGAILEGGAITPEKSANRNLYGQDFPDARSLLAMEVVVPDNIAKLQKALAQYAGSVNHKRDDEAKKSDETIGALSL